MNGTKPNNSIKSHSERLNAAKPDGKDVGELLEMQSGETTAAGKSGAPRKKLPAWRLGVYALFAVVVLYVLIAIPLPYYFIMPGKPIPASSVVHVDGGKHHSGKFYITTVIVERCNIYFYLYHFFDPQSTLRPIRPSVAQTGVLAASGPDPDRLETEETLYRAKLFALRKAGYTIPHKFDGAQVLYFLPGNLVEDKLQPGDIVTAIDNRPVIHQAQIFWHMNAVRKKSYTLTINREGSVIKKDIAPVTDAKKNMLVGVTFQTHVKRYPLPVDIRLDTEKFEGTSAGLPIYLEILNQLSKEDVAKGKRIACTGTLGEEGAIRPVEGIEYKIKGAENAACKYFLCAPDNVKTAIKNSTLSTVLPVATIDSVHEVLKKLDSGVFHQENCAFNQ